MQNLGGGRTTGELIYSAIISLQEFVPLVKAAVMSACGDCYQPCGPVNAKGEVQCVPAQSGADKLAKAGLIN